MDPPCHVLACMGFTVGRVLTLYHNELPDVLGANIRPSMGGYDSKTDGL